MTQTDFGRPLVLPDLDRWAAEHAGFDRRPVRSGRTRTALRKAAEDGFLTWPTAHGGSPKAWAEWCAANRHPPVERRPRVYAVVRCLTPRVARIEPHDRPALCELLRPFVRMRKGAVTCVPDGLVVNGVTIEESRECATLMVDLLHERLIWEGP